MTVEHRIVVGLGDIRAVTLECKTCGARLSLAPEALTRNNLWKCPSCPAEWVSDSTTDTRIFTSDLAMFLLKLQSSRETQRKGADSAVGMHVFFEFDFNIPTSSTPLPPTAK
jgi:hypothetical protein